MTFLVPWVWLWKRCFCLMHKTCEHSDKVYLYACGFFQQTITNISIHEGVFFHYESNYIRQLATWTFYVLCSVHVGCSKFSNWRRGKLIIIFQKVHLANFNKITCTPILAGAKTSKYELLWQPTSLETSSVSFYYKNSTAQFFLNWKTPYSSY